MEKYNRNIKLGYLLSFLGSGSFWWAVWVLYYLQFVDYVGVGVLESVHLFTLLFMEIPTGAIADLLGKKVSIIIAFSLISMGNLVMGFASGMDMLLISVFTITVGDAFHSGSFDALIYDSLVQLNKESLYQKVLSRIRSIKSLTIASVSIIGGTLYLIDPRLPFFVTALFFGVAAVLGILIKEPIVDTEKISLGKAVRQTLIGFEHLRNKEFVRYTIGLFIIGSVVVAGFELIDDVLVVEAGYKPNQMGMIYASFGIVAAIASQLVPKVADKLGNIKTLFFVTTLMGLAFIFTPLVSSIGVVLFIIIRVISTVFIENTTSVLINKNTPSKDRATTLSTFNMIIQLPFAVLASVIGGLIINYTIFNVAAGMGVFLLTVVAIFSFTWHINSMKSLM